MTLTMCMTCPASAPICMMTRDPLAAPSAWSRPCCPRAAAAAGSSSTSPCTMPCSQPLREHRLQVCGRRGSHRAVPRERATRPSVPFDVYATADGAAAIAAPSRPPVGGCSARRWAGPELVGGRAHQERLRCACGNRDFTNDGGPRVDARKRTTREVVEALAGRVPVGPVQNGRRTSSADPHAQASVRCWSRWTSPATNAPLTLAGAPIKLSETPSRRLPPPTAGRRAHRKRCWPRPASYERRAE